MLNNLFLLRRLNSEYIPKLNIIAIMDIAEKNAIKSLFSIERFDTVINMAAQAGVRYSLINPHVYIESNITGFLNILEGCRHNNVKHLIFASSSYVYGANTKMPFFSKKKIKEIHIVLIIALLSLPSLLAFNFYIQQVAHSSDRVYISEEDFQALMFIKNQPDGRVLSGSDIGNVLPFVTGKTSLLFDDSKTERHFDVELFYSNSTKDEKYKILKKYGISYVFYGDHEKKFGITDLEGLDFLMKIYDNVTAVYRVAA